MAQHDYDIANQSGAAFRTDLNNALDAIVTTNSGSTEPATTFAFQFWADTNANQLKMRNAANDGWIVILETDGEVPAKTFTGNITLNAQSDLRFADSDSSNWVAFQAPGTVSTNVTWTLPDADATSSGQALVSDGSGTLSWATAGGGDISDTAPERTFTNTTEEDTDGGRESKITFKGEQSGGEVSTLAQIEAHHDGTSDDEKGQIVFRTNDGSDGSSPTDRVTIDSAGQVGINTAPTRILHVKNDIAFASTAASLSDVPSKAAARIQGSSDASTSLFIGSQPTDADIYLQSTNATGSSAEQILLNPFGGNVGIGTRAPGSLLELNAAAGTVAGISLGTVDDSITADRYIGICNATNQTDLSENSGFSGIVFGGPASSGTFAEGTLSFHTHNSGTDSGEYMLIRKNGKIICGGDGGGYSVDYGGNFTVVGDADGTYVSIGRNTDQTNQMYMRNGAGTGSFTHIGFANTGGVRGSIVTSGTGTTYNETSDYRIKENVVTLTGAIDRVKQLTPKRFNFIGETRVVDGFLAHEAQTVVPEAVTGTKDQVEVWREGETLPEGVSAGDNKLDEDGNTIPELQGIDKSKLVPLLTAALQEAITKLETLETTASALQAANEALTARVAALEAA